MQKRAEDKPNCTPESKHATPLSVTAIMEGGRKPRVDNMESFGQDTLDDIERVWGNHSRKYKKLALFAVKQAAGGLGRLLGKTMGKTVGKVKPRSAPKPPPKLPKTVPGRVSAPKVTGAGPGVVAKPTPAQEAQALSAMKPKTKPPSLTKAIGKRSPAPPPPPPKKFKPTVEQPTVPGSVPPPAPPPPFGGERATILPSHEAMKQHLTGSLGLAGTPGGARLPKTVIRGGQRQKAKILPDTQSTPDALYKQLPAEDVVKPVPLQLPEFAGQKTPMSPQIPPIKPPNTQPKLNQTKTRGPADYPYRQAPDPRPSQHRVFKKDKS